MITVAEAFAVLDRAVVAGRSETIPVAEAAGRVLAREIASDVDWPPFDTSAMDGYAVRVADAISAGTRLAERSGSVAAGDAAGDPIQPGQAVRVMTGAPLPAGTEAIVPVEHVRREKGGVFIDTPPKPGAHIRRRGESIGSGSVLLPAGRRLKAADVALAAMAGADPIRVVALPRLAIAVTGNELVAASEKPPAGKLRDSNGPLLLSLCRLGGWPARALPTVRDEPAAVEQLFAENGPEEFLVTSGGVSTGDHDLLPAAAVRCGYELLFHKVAVRPGRPIAVGRRGDRFWFGLPGNPVSASVSFQLFVRYALDRREGDASPGAARIAARLVAPLRGGARETYRDAVLHEEDGESLAEPLPTRGSHDLVAHARANALIRLRAAAGELPAGSLVQCLRLER